MTKTEEILNSPQFAEFKKFAELRLREKEQYPLKDKDAIVKHLQRKFCELFLEYYHGNDRALKKEAVDLANIAMSLFIVIDGFRGECFEQ